jgi:hypothetical protein
MTVQLELRDRMTQSFPDVSDKNKVNASDGKV